MIVLPRHFLPALTLFIAVTVLVVGAFDGVH